MPINRRSDQEIRTTLGGASARVLTHESTGSKMLTVLEITLTKDEVVSYQTNDSHEESFLVVTGDVKFNYDGKTFNLTSGDCVFVPKGVPYGFGSATEDSSCVIAVCPHPDPSGTAMDEPGLVASEPGDNVMVRAQIEPYDFAPGVKRVDMVGDFRGSTSTYWSELSFEPGAKTPNHYHPAHEESMYCLEGNLSAVYGDEERSAPCRRHVHVRTHDTAYDEQPV